MSYEPPLWKKALVVLQRLKVSTLKASLLKPLHTKKSFLVLAMLFLAVGWLFTVPTMILAQGQIQLTHQVNAEVSVFGNDFVKARELAVSMAFQSALEQALRNYLGDETFEANQNMFRKVLNHADRYVQSYRFLKAIDDPIGKKSKVVIQVTLFPKALGKSLMNTGMDLSSTSSQKVVILILEKNLTSSEAGSFWETMPVSEAALVQNFIENEVNVISRDLVKESVSEEKALNAVQGNINSAVQIGLNMGADIVILGNAVSTRLENQIESEESTIQTSISVRVISVLTSTVIAAKSDFATARNEDLLTGELEAFGDASRKLSEFLLNSLDRYWKAPSAALGAEDTQPETPSPTAPPSMMEDL